MIFGKNRDKESVSAASTRRSSRSARTGSPRPTLLVHDEQAEEPYLALMLSRMFWPDFPVPVGVLRAVPCPTHDQLVDGQIQAAIGAQGVGDLAGALASGETWTVD